MLPGKINFPLCTHACHVCRNDLDAFIHGFMQNDRNLFDFAGWPMVISERSSHAELLFKRTRHYCRPGRLNAIFLGEKEVKNCVKETIYIKRLAVLIVYYFKFE